MASTLKLRGGDAATVGAITPAARELLVNTDTNRAHVGDGSTVGGNPLALLSDVTSSTGTTNLSGSGTASVYTIASDTGTDATITAATNAAAGVATAAQITELEAIRTILGGVSGGTDLGDFTGSTLSDSSVLRTVLQEVETELEAIRTSQGIAGSAADLGTFTGTIVSDNTTVKNAIQEIETDVDAIQTLTGVAAEATNLGTFTGDVITDNVTIAAAAQELETAVIKNRFTQGTEATVMNNTQNYIIIVDTSSSAQTITLPVSPYTGQIVIVRDGTGDAGTNHITVGSNIISTDFGYVFLQYSGAWKAFTSSADVIKAAISTVGVNSSYLDFDGVDDRYLFSASVANRNDFTFAAVVNYVPNGSDQVIWGGVGAGAFTNRRVLRISSTGLTQLVVGDDVNPAYGVTINAGYHSIVGTFESATTTMKLYVDGVLSSSLVFAGQFDATTVPITSASLSSASAAGYFNGQIYNAAIFSRALTAEEVKVYSSGGIPSSASGSLVVMVNGDSASGTTLYDISGNGNNSISTLGSPVFFSPSRNVFKNIVLHNTSAPTVTPSGSQFYSVAGEMYVMDSSGNSTILSPHDDLGMFEEADFHVLDPDRSFTGKSMNVFTGQAVRQYSFGNYFRVAVGDIYSGDFTVYDGDFNAVRTGNSPDLIEAGNQFRSHPYFSTDTGEMLDNYIKSSGISQDAIPENIKSKSGFNNRRVINRRDNIVE